MKLDIIINIYNKYSLPFYIICFVLYIWYVICFYKLFSKEKINKYFSLIPLYNFYLFFKLVELPFILFFVPIINIIILVLSPYKLAKRYDYNKGMCWLTVILALGMVPYICFSDKQNKYVTHNHLFIENNKDIDKLEEKLEKDAINDGFDKIKTTTNEIKEHPKEKFLDEIENSTKETFEDEIIYEDINKEETIKPPLMEEKIEELNEDEFLDEEETITTEVIEELDSKSDQNTNEKNIETNKKSYEIEEKDKTIAFGGKELVDKYSTETKNDELKCPRCGSSLVGARGICPGCGLELKNEPIK